MLAISVALLACGGSPGREAPEPQSRRATPLQSCDVLSLRGMFHLEHTRRSGDCPPVPDELERMDLSLTNWGDCKVTWREVAPTRCSVEEEFRCKSPNSRSFTKRVIEQTEDGFAMLQTTEITAGKARCHLTERVRATRPR